MFFEFKTKKNEKVAININKVLFITPYKNGTYIIDVEGNEYESSEGYESFMQRLQDTITLNMRQIV